MLALQGGGRFSKQTLATTKHEPEPQFRDRRTLWLEAKVLTSVGLRQEPSRSCCEPGALTDGPGSEPSGWGDQEDLPPGDQRPALNMA